VATQAGLLPPAIHTQATPHQPLHQFKYECAGPQAQSKLVLAGCKPAFALFVRRLWVSVSDYTWHVSDTLSAAGWQDCRRAHTHLQKGFAFSACPPDLDKFFCQSGFSREEQNPFAEPKFRGTESEQRDIWTSDEVSSSARHLERQARSSFSLVSARSSLQAVELAQKKFTAISRPADISYLLYLHSGNWNNNLGDVGKSCWLWSV